MSRIRPALLALALLATGPAASARAETIEAYALTNGLTVILRPVRSAENVALAVLYDLGGDLDPAGRSGLAHLVEHVYVTAAAGEIGPRTVGEFAAKYRLGWNAQTGDTYTVIATVFPGTDLDAELAEAALRMRSLRVTESDLEREKSRLAAEVANMYGGIPAIAAMNYARETLLPCPAGGRKGGRPEDVETISLREVQARLDAYYTPRHATLVLAGNLEPERATARIAASFASIPRGGAAPPAPAGAAGSPGEVEIVSVRPRLEGSSPEACVAYPAPLPGDPLYPPFLVLAARLWTEIQGFGPVPAHYVVSYSFLDDPKVLYVRGPIEDAADPMGTAAAIEALVRRTVSRPFEASDIPLARNAFGFLLGIQEIADGVIAQNLYGVAFSLGRRAQLGVDPDRLGAALEHVSADEVRRTVERCFGRDRAAAALVMIEEDDP